MSDLRKVMALWSKTGKSGATFYSGTIDVEAMTAALHAGETRVLMFPVKTKRERGPDFEVFAASEQPRSAPAPTPASHAPAVPAALEDDDDLPF